ncbi:DNA primase [compost metagenome]
MIDDLLRVNKLAYSIYESHASAVNEYLDGRGIAPSYHRNGNQINLGYAPKDNALLKAITKMGDPDLLKAAIDLGLLKRSEGGRLYDFFRNRLMIPIVSDQGIIGFGGRVLDSDSPQSKYINSQESELFDKGNTLFRADGNAKDVEWTLVVEGYMDVIKLAQHGFSADAGMGTALSQNQIKSSLDRGMPVVLLFDGDAAGLKAAHKAAITALSVIAPERQVLICLLDDGYDPDDFVREFGANALRTHVGLNAISVVEFVAKSKSDDLDDSIRHFVELFDVIQSANNPYAANAVAHAIAARYPEEMVEAFLVDCPPLMTTPRCK